MDPLRDAYAAASVEKQQPEKFVGFVRPTYTPRSYLTKSMRERDMGRYLEGTNAGGDWAEGPLHAGPLGHGSCVAESVSSAVYVPNIGVLSLFH